MNEPRLRELALGAIEKKTFPGCVIGVVDKAGNRKALPFGRFTYDTDASLVHEDTQYDVASITKTVPVALAALSFIERGLIKLDDQIITYVPEITIKNAEKGLVRHLLTYTYVLQKNTDPSFSYEHARAADMIDFLYHRELEYLPGTHYQYANGALNLLGLILERVSGKKLYVLAQEIIFDPLEMRRATFKPADPQIIPPAEISSWRGVVQGVVHDETAHILQNEGFNPGCAGLFSDAGDLLNVVEMMLNNGIYRGTRVFAPDTMSLMTNNALASLGEWAAIGWELNQPKFMGKYSNEHTIGKTGFTGTCLVIDLEKDLGVVMLSNRTYPTRPANNDAINEFRRAVADIVFAP